MFIACEISKNRCGLLGQVPQMYWARRGFSGVLHTTQRRSFLGPACSMRCMPGVFLWRGDSFGGLPTVFLGGSVVSSIWAALASSWFTRAFLKFFSVSFSAAAYVRGLWRVCLKSTKALLAACSYFQHPENRFFPPFCASTCVQTIVSNVIIGTIATIHVLSTGYIYQ